MDDTAARNFTETLIAAAIAPPPSAQYAETARLARQCVLDWIAVTLAGQAEPLVESLSAVLREEGGAPQASVLGTPHRVSVSQAALLNGTASHALDYDDVNYALMGHPSVPVLPALLALAEWRGLEGAQLLAAFVAGYEFECRAGLAVAPSHYARGFHATATLGALGSALACAQLLQLDPTATAHAVGIAVTQSAGLKSMFGSDCKPLHAGSAARIGVVSAQLAARGFTSRTDSLECDQGFAATHADALNVAAALAVPRGGLHLRDNLFKYHASCYETHATIEASLKLREAHRLVPDEILAVEIRVNPYCDRICNIPAPESGLQAKFSLRQTATFALAGLDTADIATFNNAAATDSALCALRERCQVVLDSVIPASQASVSITCKDGRQVTARHDASQPLRDLDLQQSRLEAKAHSLLDARIGADRCDLILRAVHGMGDPGGLRGLLGCLAECAL